MPQYKKAKNQPRLREYGEELDWTESERSVEVTVSILAVVFNYVRVKKTQT